MNQGQAILFLAGGLAGCFSDVPTETNDLLVEFENQGGVLGVVLDDQQLPIDNATVYVGDEDRARTNVTG